VASQRERARLLARRTRSASASSCAPGQDCVPPRPGGYPPGMHERQSRPDRDRFDAATLGEAQSSNPPDDPDMIDPDSDPLDTDVEDADLFLGEDE
jgi:hypothetical protein